MSELNGRVTIDPDVLVTIARLTTLSVPGVTRMAPSRARKLLRRISAEGVQIAVEDNAVQVDLYIAIEAGRSLRDTACAVQEQVARAIRDMVGMDVSAINIHVEEVDFPTSPA